GVAEVVVEALDAGTPLVTDVGSVKAPIVAEVEAARPATASRFVGGHPMAGSEQEGLDGADARLFVGATWVLTPTGHTDPAAFAAVRGLAAQLGAEPVAVAPELHDALVAVVSHVPQLAASTLMSRLGVNISDLEIAHSIEGRSGVLVLVVAERGLADFEAALAEHGYHTARTPLR